MKNQTKEQLKKEIATRVVTKIIQNLGQDAASQATQLALMDVIGANINTNAPVLQDRADFLPLLHYLTQQSLLIIMLSILCLEVIMLL